MHRLHDDSTGVDFICGSLCQGSLYRLRTRYAIDDSSDGIRRNCGVCDQCISNVADLGTLDTFLYVDIDVWLHVLNDVPTRRQTGWTTVLGDVCYSCLRESYSAPWACLVKDKCLKIFTKIISYHLTLRSHHLATCAFALAQLLLSFICLLCGSVMKSDFQAKHTDVLDLAIASTIDLWVSVLNLK